MQADEVPGCWDVAPDCCNVDSDPVPDHQSDKQGGLDNPTEGCCSEGDCC